MKNTCRNTQPMCTALNLRYRIPVPVFMVIRSEYDSLDIWLGNLNFDLSSKNDKEYSYGSAPILAKGSYALIILTKKYCF
jgi:hypothetical protein